MESIARLYYTVRPQAKYDRSLELLRRAKERAPGVLTKSGMMLGVGEEDAELVQSMADLRSVDCDILTLGQYLRPSAQHIPVRRYVPPETFAAFKRLGLEMGSSMWRRDLWSEAPTTRMSRCLGHRPAAMKGH
jgi:lipoic acid synthetase